MRIKDLELFFTKICGRRPYIVKKGKTPVTQGTAPMIILKNNMSRALYSSTPKNSSTVTGGRKCFTKKYLNRTMPNSGKYKINKENL